MKPKRFIKRHPEIFNVDDMTYHTITDSEIPDIQWFYENNSDIIKSTQKEKRGHRLSKIALFPASAILVFAILLAVTPAGRAMAGELYKTVISWVSGEVSIWHGTSETPPDEINIDKGVYQSIEEVESEYGINVAMSNNGTLDKIEVEKTDFQIILDSTYSFSDDSTILITQTIEDTDTESSVSISFDDGQPVKEKTLDEVDVIGYVKDGIGYAVAFEGNSKIEVYTETVTYKQFTDFIRYLKIK